MKMIINGKKYDTETATLVLSYPINRKLYKKRTGEFFEYSGLDGITPLSLDRAKNIVETYENELYEDIFGKVEE